MENPEENLDFLNVFDQTSKREQILVKIVFLLKVSHIQINYAFLMFLEHFGGNSQKPSLFSPKSYYLRK